LLPVDSLSPARTTAALAEAIRICRQEPTVAVHLLSVQPVYSSHVAMCFGTGELHKLEEKAGLEELAPAQALLDAASVRYTSSVMIGHSAETIARAAREFGCDRIVMGGAASESVAPTRVFGSLAGQVRHIMEGSADCQVIGA